MGYKKLSKLIIKLLDRIKQFGNGSMYEFKAENKDFLKEIETELFYTKEPMKFNG